MTDGAPPPDGVDDRPLDPKTPRTVKVGALLGIGLGVLLAGMFAAAGADGRAGFAGFLVGLAFGSAVAALYGVGSGALDVLRGQPVGRSRLLTAGAFFVASLLFTIMFTGLGG